MKLLSALILSLFLIPSCGEKQKDTKAENDNSENVKSKVVVVYSHFTDRCSTCRSVEEQTKNTIDMFFKDEEENNQIEFIVFNIEEEKNQPLIDKYKIDGQSLVIMTYDKEGNSHYKNITDFAFTNIHNQGEYVEKLKEIIDNEVAKI